jgi:molybdopterin molybdotransferase
MIAAANREAVLCRPKPRVVIVSTGSELVEVGAPLGRGQLPDSNSHMLTAAVREAGALAYRVGVVPDDPERLLEALEDHLIRADVLVTSGGVSVGAYDVVKEVLTRLGTVKFEEVAMQPGKPQGFGSIGAEQVPIFTLPGNPVSALVSFEVFVRPALRRMLGAAAITRPQLTVEVAEPMRSPAGKRSFLRALVERDASGRLLARQSGGQGSHMLTGMAAANALLVVPEEMSEVPAGTQLPAMLLERRGP